MTRLITGFWAHLVAGSPTIQTYLAKLESQTPPIPRYDWKIGWFVNIRQKNHIKTHLVIATPNLVGEIAFCNNKSAEVKATRVGDLMDVMMWPYQIHPMMRSNGWSTLAPVTHFHARQIFIIKQNACRKEFHEVGSYQLQMGWFWPL